MVNNKEAASQALMFRLEPANYNRLLILLERERKEGGAQTMSELIRTMVIYLLDQERI